MPLRVNHRIFVPFQSAQCPVQLEWKGASLNAVGEVNATLKLNQSPLRAAILDRALSGIWENGVRWIFMSENCLCDINKWAPLVNLLLFYYSSSVLWAVELVSRHAQWRALGKQINVTLIPSPSQSFSVILPRVPCGKQANGARYNVLHLQSVEGNVFVCVCGGKLDLIWQTLLPKGRVVDP